MVFSLTNLRLTFFISWNWKKNNIKRKSEGINWKSQNNTISLWIWSYKSETSVFCNSNITLGITPGTGTWARTSSVTESASSHSYKNCCTGEYSFFLNLLTHLCSQTIPMNQKLDRTESFQTHKRTWRVAAMPTVNRSTSLCNLRHHVLYQLISRVFVFESKKTLHFGHDTVEKYKPC